ncbi:MAG: prepilin-type N-terminal cleavage/methylation domain-containing protein [Nitrospirae bacterium]|nr:prepilin-type N-terminal cleavage/methylation domain-containing protein [Nitrospirota bacterium]
MSIVLPPAFVAEEGFSLIEVMLAMVVLAFALLGSMGMFQWADHGLQVGANGTHALAMATTRLEAKRAVSWDALLTDDLDSDGRPEIEMRDDGAGTDAEAGDGVYSASVEDGGIRLMWTVELQQGPSLRTAGSAVIQVRASYPVGRGKRRELQVGTLRANPRYLGAW